MAYQIIGEQRPGPWVISCDHASNAVPDWISGGDLGLPEADMARHIAWDVGAAGLAQELGRVLDSPVILSSFSRLVIDLNRGEDDPTLVMQLYDGTVIPANRALDGSARTMRQERLYRPYHAALGRLMARRETAALLAVHSFTPCLRGRPPRPWHVGVLHSHLDTRLSRVLIDRLQREVDLCVGDNEPYSGHLPGDSVDRHALRSGRHNTLIELRNDLIADPDGQQSWARRLGPVLGAALADVGG